MITAFATLASAQVAQDSTADSAQASASSVSSPTSTADSPTASAIGSLTSSSAPTIPTGVRGIDILYAPTSSDPLPLIMPGIATDRIQGTLPSLDSGITLTAAQEAAIAEARDSYEPRFRDLAVQWAAQHRPGVPDDSATFLVRMRQLMAEQQMAMLQVFTPEQRTQYEANVRRFRAAYAAVTILPATPPAPPTSAVAP